MPSSSPQQIGKGVLYVSAWVLIWGTAASIADALLLGRGIYETASSGQALTFAAYGMASVVLAVRLSGRFLGRGAETGGEG